VRGAELLGSRDTEHDVGTGIFTPSELSRPDLESIARANAARLTEALRSMEEAAKGLGAASGAFEGSRYRAYVLEQRLVVALGRPGVPAVRLCVLITASLCVRPWTEVVEASIAGGCNMVQLREKSLSDRELLHRARLLVEICRRRSPAALVFINDRADIAVLSDADGVHVGPEDMLPADARGVLGPRRLLGVSTDTVERARAAAGAGGAGGAWGADLCGVGPMFETSTKAKPVTLGPAYLSAYLADPVASGVPHLAIGGITPENLPELVARGCKGIAVSSVVCGSRDPEAVCRELCRSLNARDDAGSLAPSNR
jgi:thiamine-phosphate pyrophosphorylase